MVRLLGRIPEKAILATHDVILKHGRVASMTAQSQTPTLAINTGFNSVIKGWAVYVMKTPPAGSIGLNCALPEGVSSVGATFYIGNIYTMVGGSFTIDWFAIGD